MGVLARYEFEVVGRDVPSAGYETDIRAPHRLDGHALYAECKAHGG